MTVKQLKKFLELLPDEAGVKIQVGDYNKYGKLICVNAQMLKEEKGRNMYWAPTAGDFIVNDCGVDLVIYGETR